MADYTQSGGKNGGTYAKYYTGKLSVWENSYDVASNSSNVGYRLQLLSGSSGQFSGLNANYSVTIDGVCRKSGSGSYSLGHNGTITLCEGNFTVWHNEDGKKNISCSAVIDFQSHSYSPGDFYPSGSLGLTSIPRTPVFTENPSVVSKGLNWIKFRCGSLNIASDIYYSFDNSNWVHITSYETTISNLTPEKTYTIYVQARNQADNNQKTTKTISATTYAIAKLTSTPNVNIGSAHTITWTNPSGASTSLKLCKTDNSTIIDYGTVTGTSKSITPTASKIYPLTPNSNTYKARYIITTTANGKSYTNSKDFTFTVTNSNPTFLNFTYQDTNTTITALTGNNQILVNGYSNVKATVSTANKATAKNNATMKTYKLAIGNKNTSANYNASADVNLSINTINNNVIDLYAIDSRGNSTKVSKTATIKNYSNIKIKSLSLARQNNVGTVTTLKFEGEFWNASFGNVANVLTTCKYKYKSTSSSTWVDGKTTLTYTISGNKITGNLNIQGDLGTDGFNANSSYNIQLILADKLSTATYDVILSSGNPALAIYKNNVAIGQQYNTSEGSKLQVNGDINEDGTKLKNKYSNISHTHGLLNNNMTATISNTTTNSGWSMINSSYNGFLLKSLRAQSSAPEWLQSNYSAGICFGGADTKGVISHAYNAPEIKFAGGNGSKPVWWFQLKATNGNQYTLPNTTGTILIPKTLYDNSSGTTGTITLNETSANFSSLEIFFSRNTNMGYDSAKIFGPNGKKANLHLAETGQNGLVLYNAIVAISGTSITFRSGKGISIYALSGSNSGVWCDGVGSTNEIKIYKVIGYR